MWEENVDVNVNGNVNAWLLCACVHVYIGGIGRGEEGWYVHKCHMRNRWPEVKAATPQLAN